MNDKKEYNGWSNYETWNCALWLGDGETSFWEERAEDLWKSARGTAHQTRKDEAIDELADELRQTIEDRAAEALPASSMFSDLLTAAISEINFHEIASGYFENVDTTEDEETEEASENEA